MVTISPLPGPKVCFEHYLSSHSHNSVRSTMYLILHSIGGYPLPTQSVLVSYVQRQFTIQTLTYIINLRELLAHLA